MHLRVNMIDEMPHEIRPLFDPLTLLMLQVLQADPSSGAQWIMEAYKFAIQVHAQTELAASA